MRNLIFISFLLLLGCSSKQPEQISFGRMNQFEDQNIVVTAIANKGVFYREFESNGKLKAVRRAKLKFELNETILSVGIENGQRVVKGQVLSILDEINQRNDYERSQRRLQSVRLGFEDALINMGYQLKDSLTIPKPVMEIALIRSGYPDAVSDTEMARIRLEKTRLQAPFSGIVADLDAKPYNKAHEFDRLCVLIDDSSFEIEFPVLESEAHQLSAGMPLVVVPYAFDQDTIAGSLLAINPMVNESGMVSVKALVPNTSGKLTEGMNAKVMVREAVRGKTIVPKSAVTLRQERKVVFVCINDTAHWRYVNVEEENSQFCTLSGEDVKPDEEVIIDGNFNLSHLVPVVKMNK